MWGSTGTVRWRSSASTCSWPAPQRATTGGGRGRRPPTRPDDSGRSSCSRGPQSAKVEGAGSRTSPETGRRCSRTWRAAWATTSWPRTPPRSTWPRRTTSRCCSPTLSAPSASTLERDREKPGLGQPIEAATGDVVVHAERDRSLRGGKRIAATARVLEKRPESRITGRGKAVECHSKEPIHPADLRSLTALIRGKRRRERPIRIVQPLTRFAPLWRPRPRASRPVRIPCRAAPPQTRSSHP